MNTTTHSSDVIIVGGGIGGLSAAFALTRKGFKVRVLRARDTYDYTYTEWIYGPTALVPEDEPEMYPIIPLDSAQMGVEAAAG